MAEVQIITRRDKNGCEDGCVSMHILISSDRKSDGVMEAITKKDSAVVEPASVSTYHEPAVVCIQPAAP